MELGESLIFVAWSSSRKAISPVPPAMSSIFQPSEVELVEEPGLRLRTKWSLQLVRVPYLRGSKLGATYFHSL